MRSHLVTFISAALITLASAPPVVGGGCGIPIYTGRTGDRLHFWVLQSSKPTRFSLDTKSSEGSASEIEKGAIPPRPGSGSRAWSARRRGSGAEVKALPECRISAVSLPFAPTAFSWAEDAGKTPWLFFAGMHDDRAAVSVQKFVDGEWHAVAMIDGELRSPRLDRKLGTLIMGPWRSDAKPFLHLPPDTPARDTVEWFSVDGRTLVITRQKKVWSTLDGGLHWTAVATPSFTEIVPTDDDAPAISWSEGSTLHVAHWRNEKWVTVAKFDKRAHDVTGPIVVTGSSVVALGGCYHFDRDGEWIARTIHFQDERTAGRLPLKR